jgi:hypothetical protein
MRKLRTTVLAGIAAAAVAGTAIAASRDVHTLNVLMPDGSVAHVIYHGDVAPQVRLEAARNPAPVHIGLSWPLSYFDRLSAELDRQADLIFNQAAAFADPPWERNGALNLASLKSLPRGAAEYYEATTSTDNGSCIRIVQMTSDGSNRAPKVSTKLSGTCAPEEARPASSPGSSRGLAASNATQSTSKPLTRT